MNKPRPWWWVGVLTLGLWASAGAQAWDMNGEKTLRLHSRDGRATVVGSVVFTPAGERTAVKVRMDPERLQDFFLSMREFKCLEGQGEVLCHVPYPYPNPATVTPADLRWLEHALLFMFKTPKDFGAKLWNGVYFRLQRSERGLVGTPQAVDLNQIGAPPSNPTLPPYGPAERSDFAPEARWFHQLSIE